MPKLTRRRALAAGGVALAGTLAGCTGGSSSASTPQTRIGGLEVTNTDDDAHTVHVLLLKSGEPIYWQSLHIGTNADGESGHDTLSDFPTDVTPDTLVARLDGAPKSEWSRFDFDEEATDCIVFDVRVESATGSDERPTLSIWNSNDCERPSSDGGPASN